jgi:hypothetical protein
VGTLLHLHDAHEQTQTLLPWHLNGTLTPPERALVDAHLAECGECRADLEAEAVLQGQFANLQVGTDVDPDRGWAVLRTRVAAGAGEAKVERLPLLRRRVALGWMLAGQAAVAACAAIAFMAVPRAEPEPGYRLLGSPAQPAGGNAIVLFTPDATEHDLRAALQQAGGRIVDGPTASGAYVIRVPEAELGRALDHLRAAPAVTLAEPISSGDG